MPTYCHPVASILVTFETYLCRYFLICSISKIGHSSTCRSQSPSQNQFHWLNQGIWQHQQTIIVEHFVGVWHSTQSRDCDRADLHELKVLCEDWGWVQWLVQCCDRSASGVFALFTPFHIGHWLGADASNTRKGHTVDGGEKTCLILTSQMTSQRWLGTHKIHKLVTEISDSASSITIKKTKNMLTGTHSSPLNTFIDQKRSRSGGWFHFSQQLNQQQWRHGHRTQLPRGESISCFQSTQQNLEQKELLSIKLRFFFFTTPTYSPSFCMVTKPGTWKLARRGSLTPLTQNTSERLSIKWNNLISNKEVRQRANQCQVADMIYKHCPIWLGQVTTLQTHRPNPSMEPSRSKE